MPARSPKRRRKTRAISPGIEILKLLQKSFDIDTGTPRGRRRYRALQRRVDALERLQDREMDARYGKSWRKGPTDPLLRRLCREFGVKPRRR